MTYKQLTIVYNGEVYNFKQIRAELEQLGHRFQSNCDTEVILHAYEAYGDHCVQRFNGMFAFAIWDAKLRKLFLARDRLGIKPLYYYWDQEKFLFASEIKALLQAPIKRAVNREAAFRYFSLRYVAGEDTLFRDIKKLLPGHILTLQDNIVKIRRYWDIPLPEPANGEHAEMVQNLLRESVERRLIADVPVGVYLSGGIDSASIVALAANLKAEPVKTFSVGFDRDNRFDELHKARKIAEHFNTDHQEIVVQPRVAELLPKLIWHLDMPHGDPVIIAQHQLSKLAAKKVKVVLSGEGADELFGGYVQYKTMLRAQALKKLPLSVIRDMTRLMPVKLLDKFYDYPESIGDKGREKLVEFLGDLQDDRKAYEDLISIMSRQDKELLLREQHQPDGRYFYEERKPLLNKLLYYDSKTWLPNYVLHINDRMTMMHSIEGRVPFLDHTMVEYATKIPAHLKVQGKIDKVVLRKAMAPMLPPQAAKAKKHAFFMPMDSWVKQELAGLAQELFKPEDVKARGYFNYFHLRKIWERYDQSKLIYGKQLFTLINFELWHRMFIDYEKPTTKLAALL